MTGKSLALIGWIVLFAAGPATTGSQQEEGAEAPAGKNRLAKETSPYLRLHADNPVDWYPWGPEAFAKAKAEDKPIFLSIGYSSCYWCHVMERESFESEAIAKLLNENFICIKVDREERPDVDQIYMVAAQAFGRGGWPLSAFLTPDGRPFFAGTYYPPTDRDGLPGFPRVLGGIRKAWSENRKAIDGTAGDMAEFIKKGTAPALPTAPASLSRAMCASGRAWLSREFDPEYGGFGYDPANARIPKFPEPSNILFLLDQHRREKAGQAVPILPPSPLMLAPAPDRSPLEMALTTLDRMARGGIRDQIGGGYHRYSVSRYWIVPHFEKMLYDNAQIASALISAYELTGDERWKREAIDTLDFVLRDMTTPEGGFMSAIDAESEGVEGKSYVWTRAEVDEALGKGADVETFLQVYGLKRPPNFEEDRYVLLQPRPLADQAKALGISAEELEGKLKPLRAKLLAARGRRAAPLKDDKVITAWNGLMIAALAEGARAFDDDQYREAAGRAADLLLGLAAKDEGRLPRVYREGKAKGPAYLEDYAFLAWGLIRLREATGDDARLDQARALADRMVADFPDEARGGFFFTPKDLDDLIARPKDPTDGVLPGGNSVAIRVLARLGREQKREADLDLAGKSLEGFAGPLQQRPGSSPHLLIALEEYFDARPGAAKAPPAPSAPTSAAIVAAKAEAKGGDPIAPGSEIEAVLTLTIKEGWHIYANPPRPANLKGTTVEPGPEAKLAALRAKWPRGEDKVLASSGSERVGVYEGTIEVPVRIRLPEDAPAGPAAIPLRVKFQPCDDKVCLAPASLDVTLSVTIQPPAR